MSIAFKPNKLPQLVRKQDPPSRCQTSPRLPSCPSQTSVATKRKTISVMALPRTSSRSFRASPSSLLSPAIRASSTKASRPISGKLGVQYVLEAGIRHSGHRSRITAQLVDAITGAHCWTDRYDREVEDIFAVQDDVALTIVCIPSCPCEQA